MKEFADVLLPELPEALTWVYGVVYIIECICFFGMLLMPFITIYNIIRRKR